MKGWILVVLVGLVGVAHGGQWGAQIHLASKHYVSGDYNEFNPGAGIVYRGDDLIIGAGGYRNSFDKDTYYIGAGKHFRSGISLMVAYATGYDGETPSPISPVIQYKKGHILLTLLSGAVGIGIEF